MENAYQKTLTAWVAAFTLITLGACSYVDEVESPHTTQANEGSALLLKIASPKNVTSIDLFQFSDGVLVKKLTVDPSSDNVVELARKPNARIYALAGYTVEDSQKLSESRISAMTIPVPKDSHSAPVFFSSVTIVHDIFKSEKPTCF